MKVLVLKSFIDKINDILYRPGDEIEVSKKRCSEINATSLFVEEINKQVGGENDTKRTT